jgi:tRNA-dihydrouridine synthase A
MKLSRLFSVAPMMDYTDKHARYFLRLFSSHVLLYTEMITAQALIHGDVDYLLDFHLKEHPIALQLGGSDPTLLAHSAKLGEKKGYDEINLNVGCPSPRVQSGRFGACLMKEPELVADCFIAMQECVSIPVTIKCRIGVDDYDDYPCFSHFIDRIKQAGCDTFIIHARKAWLKGLSPKQNRDIPPLKYDVVHRLKSDFKELTIVINGGLKTINDVDRELQLVDGVMIGRSVFSNPYLLSELEKKYFPDTIQQSRVEIIMAYLPYFEDQAKRGVNPSVLIKPILGLFQGQEGAKIWRRHLSEQIHRVGALAITQALERIEKM